MVEKRLQIVYTVERQPNLVEETATGRETAETSRKTFEKQPYYAKIYDWLT